MKNKLVLIDGNSILYRAFFALPLLSNSKGIYTNAVYGFAQMLLKVLDEEKPTHLLVAFDASKKTFRHEKYEEYKGGRQKTPPELSEQIPFVHDLLDAFRISKYELENYEADDVIGTLSKQAEDENWEVKVITGDKDLLQLVSDRVSVALTRKGITDVDTYDPVALRERYGIDASQIIDMKSLMGDPSDNIPGVPGVGEKTALKLLKQFGSLETILNSIDEISGKKIKETLENNHDLALLSKELVTIDRNSPIEVSLNDVSYGNYDQESVVRLFTDLEFKSLLDRFEHEESEEAESDSKIDISFETVTELSSNMLKGETALIVEVMEENYHQAEIQGIAIVNETGKYFMTAEDACKSAEFKQWLNDETKKKITFDKKRAEVALGWQNIEIKGFSFDVLIASYLLNTTESRHDIAEIANRENITYVQSDESVYGKGAKRKMPEREALANHLIRKAQAVYELKDILTDKLEKNEQYSLFDQLEMPLSNVLAQMELQGIKVDIDRLKNMGKELDERLKTIEQEVYEEAGVKFNLNSPKQLGEVLFDKLNLPVIKKTKTGYSTSADVLEKLQNQHEIIPKILLYRQLGKLYSTYIEGLLKVVNNNTGKIHTRFNQVLTQTGRLSSIDPNLQNIPIRLEEGRKIRQAFIPSKKGWVIFAADYSQIELRVLAHIAQDEKLIQAFKEDMDIHTKTAMDVFHVAKEEVTPLMRRHAKAVNFGIVYGISDYGLSQSLSITRKEAGEFIDRYLKSFPGVKRYMDEIVQKAKSDGFVTTLLHRRRYLPEIKSRNYNLRSFAERTAMNTPIQGSAADIIKKAMIEMNNRLQSEKLETNMLLQVHDELIFEAPEHEIDKLKQIVPEVMEQAVELDVPLKVDYSYGATWYDAK
ncbi:DNA polymerase I [Pueribacillus theae]|uniref:DNA polymerase I n=1 Tax=Pueribacillus theae TaxID=2171751 RepID=A0A2U1JJZ2_9BACI|nr:DNA polymerase I [Pueribacillus theae]PWA05457.1 DNA polymerase I [Pueribacillus theae]